MRISIPGTRRVLEFQMHLPTTCWKCPKCVAELCCRRVILKSAHSAISAIDCYGSVHCLGQRGTVRAGWRRALMWPEAVATVNWHWQVGDTCGGWGQETLHAQQQQLSGVKTLISGEHFSTHWLLCKQRSCLIALLTASQHAAFVFHLAAQCTYAGGRLQITAVRTARTV